jgi:phenylalanyl-tRNA synthetase beta chain
MKILYSWLKEFVPLDRTAGETASALMQLGFEVSSLQALGGSMQGVVAGYVRDVQKHPNADRLSLCRVTDGQQEFSVVCGASNVRAGIHVPFARLGAVLPGGHAIGPSKIRGVDSQGMICSAAELGLEEKSDGILILGDEAPLGSDIRPLLGLDDTLFEIEIAPNRRDALSVLGIARELAAGFNLPLKAPEPRVRTLEPGNNFTIQVEEPGLCPRYTGRLIRNVKVGPSPAWMANRLRQCGFRPINNIVDITNYVMLELGQPLHAFDTAKIQGRTIRVRAALENEPFVTLDGQKLSLPQGTLIIADEKTPVALAGIMGGINSGISEATTEVLLESAAFDQGHIRRNSKKLGISTESSYRFERGNDWNMVMIASVRAGQLIQELAEGIGHKPIDVSTQTVSPVIVQLPTERLKQRLGLDLKESAMADILRRLGCIINTAAGQLVVTVPSWRLDLASEADLYEEIARICGYDNIPSRLPSVRTTAVKTDPFWSFEREIIRMLAGLGLTEALNTSFMPPSASAFVPGLGQAPDAKSITIANPLSQDVALLRTSLLPGLLQNAVTNFNRQASGVSLAEAGRVFFRDATGLQEKQRIGLIRAGEVRRMHWRQKPQKTDYYDMRGILNALLESLHISRVELSPGAHPIFHPGRSARLLHGPNILGWFGEIHPALRDKLDLSEPVAMAELDLPALLEAAPGTLKNKTSSAFPPVKRDLSIVVAEDAPFAKILKIIQSAGSAMLESVSLIDLYRGQAIGGGKKSFTFSLVFRHMSRTLTDAEIEKQMQKIFEDLKKSGAEQRK